jgi:nucleoid-associated protein YgaU
MGLFDFASNLGKKLFGSNEDPAEKIQSHIESDNPGIDGLTVTVEDGVATLTGSAKNQAAYEKAILMAGNVQGIKEVKADALQLEDTTTSEVGYYTIQAGDSLWAIAQKHLGNGNHYTKIFEANKEVIKDPDMIYPGQKIRIPLEKH